jgi:hypothetical protein
MEALAVARALLYRSGIVLVPSREKEPVMWERFFGVLLALVTVVGLVVRLPFAFNDYRRYRHLTKM